MRLVVLKSQVPVNEVLVETPDLSESYEIFVGRSEDCHVQIQDPLISRHHFVLKNNSGNWICEKLTNLGTVSVNGAIAPKIEIREGDEIKCGAYSILVSGLGTPKVQEYQAPAPEPLPQYTPPVETLASLPEDGPIEPEPLEETALDVNSLDEMPQDDLSSLDEPMESLESESFESNEESSEENFDFGNSDNAFGEGESLDEDVAGFGGDLVPGDEAGEENESTRFFKAFVNYQLVIFGEFAPYDRFLIEEDEIFIGRDPKKCQIILNDPEVSTVHAVVRKNLTDVVLEDLNSSNGTILNGERINKANLSTGDEFLIGSTTFTLEVRSDLLEAESERLMPVEANQVIETEEIHEEEIVNDDTDLDFSSEAPQEKSIIKRIWKDPVKRKKAIYVVAGLVFAWVMLDPPADEAPPAQTGKKETKTNAADVKPKIQLSPQQEKQRNQSYELGASYFEQGDYSKALKEFQTVFQIDPNYKKISAYLEGTQNSLKRLEELEAQKRAEEERIKTKKLIEEILVKAREAVKERNVTMANNYFSQITEKDPENIEVQQLKMDLEAWQKEQERIALEKAAKEAARKKMLDRMQPGKTYYLKKEWYRATLKLEDFLRQKGNDEDLVKEASDMLSDAKNQLASELGPILGKARSLKEGQDLRNAYEAYLEVLRMEPTNAEALNEVDEIKSSLDSRSKKLYREAIIAESLSLFNDAREKFQEVQQISPTDSEYYKKASDKLKSYYLE